MNRGLFITFEGIDGCGKSTQLRRAHEWLAGRGVRSVVTREPGGTAIAEQIRTLLLSPDSGEMRTETEVLLYLAARAQHVAEKIRPAVESGMVVLCDRFQEATFAYQGYGRGYDLHVLQQLNFFATGGMHPTLTFVIDVPVEVALDRMRSMNKAPDRLEQNSEEFYERTRAGYRALAEMHPERSAVLDGTRTINEIAAQVRARLEPLIG